MPRIEDLAQVGFNPNEAKHIGVVTDGVEGTFSALTAAGSTSQANAYQIIGNYNQFTTVTSSNNSAKLPLAINSANGVIIIRNADTADAMALFPGVGDNLNGLAADASITIPTSGFAACYRYSNTGWIVLRGTDNSLSDIDGTYTPTTTNVANLDSSSAQLATYLRIGSAVTVAGQFNADATAAAGTLTQLRMTLPFASNFANVYECGGVANARSSVIVSASIFADATNNEAFIEYRAGGTADIAYYYTFTYRII